MTERFKEDRLKQIENLESQGINPYPAEIPKRTHINALVVHNFDELVGSEVSVVGRIRGIREHGKRTFADIEDESGKLQVTLTPDSVGQDQFVNFGSNYATGDIISVTGSVFKTKSGEVTVSAGYFDMLAKALLPPPNELKDVETRTRQRYLDMIVNPEVRERFKFRSQMVQAMRERFMQLGCWEVETPVLDTTYGGASAKPFETHHNALGENLYLRISNELYLKRLVIGGLEGVFEFSRDFRNEGMDKTHNPEFTQVELYLAYRDYNFMMEMSENLIADIAQKYLGTTQVEYQGQQIDLSVPWKRLSIYEGVKETLGIDADTVTDDELLAIAKNEGIEESDRGYILLELFDRYVSPDLVNPTFVIDYPESTSPLTKKHRSKEGLTERFECVVAGMEVSNCYTELNDPRTQRANFEAELKRRFEGDENAMPTDDDFILAMEYGMPPMGGIGISIDRWLMILKNLDHIRETIAFPTMKPKESRTPKETKPKKRKTKTSDKL